MLVYPLLTRSRSQILVTLVYQPKSRLIAPSGLGVYGVFSHPILERMPGISEN